MPNADKLHVRRDLNLTLVYPVVSPELDKSGALPIMLLTYDKEPKSLGITANIKHGSKAFIL